VLADVQPLGHHGLVRRLRSMDAEDEIAAGRVDFVIQFNRESKSEHGGDSEPSHHLIFFEKQLSAA
jgi:hypothetical protein